jgi:hypothetical protein
LSSINLFQPFLGHRDWRLEQNHGQVDETARILGTSSDQEEMPDKDMVPGPNEKGARSLDVISTRLYPFQESAMHLAFSRRALWPTTCDWARRSGHCSLSFAQRTSRH